MTTDRELLAPVAQDVRVVRVAPHKRWRFLDLRELWAYRELVFFLTWRDITVRYKQTAIGVVWVLLQPLAMVGVFTLFFGRLAGLPSDGVPYPLFVFAAFLPWQVFSRAISESSNSLVADQRLITRVYFPRILVPTSSIVAAIFDFCITSLIFLVMMALYRWPLTWHIIFLPLFLVLMVMTAAGMGYWLSALNIEYRDVSYALPFINQLWLFASPIVYAASIVPPRWRTIYGLNPMAGVVDGFRWALLGIGPGPSAMLAVSATISVLLFVSGIIWFLRRENSMADIVGSGGR